jgi:hypothetical protein
VAKKGLSLLSSLYPLKLLISLLVALASRDFQLLYNEGSEMRNYIVMFVAYMLYIVCTIMFALSLGRGAEVYWMLSIVGTLAGAYLFIHKFLIVLNSVALHYRDYLTAERHDHFEQCVKLVGNILITPLLVPTVCFLYNIDHQVTMVATWLTSTCVTFCFLGVLLYWPALAHVDATKHQSQ